MDAGGEDGAKVVFAYLLLLNAQMMGAACSWHAVWGPRNYKLQPSTSKLTDILFIKKSIEAYGTLAVHKSVDPETLESLIDLAGIDRVQVWKGEQLED